MEENVIDGKRGKLILKKSISNDETQIYYQNDSPSTVIIGNFHFLKFFKNLN